MSGTRQQVLWEGAVRGALNAVLWGLKSPMVRLAVGAMNRSIVSPAFVDVTRSVLVVSRHNSHVS